MQANVNVIVMEGGLIRDPELKYTAEGLAYAKFCIANTGITFKKGEKGEEVSFFDVTTWGKLAEVCSAYLKKGSKIIISGRIRQNRWKNEKGEDRSKMQIIAQDVKFLPARKQVKAD